MILKGLKEKLRNRFNIALAEEDYADLWQRAKLSLVTVGAEKQMVMSTFEKALEQIDQNKSLQIINSTTEYF